MDQTIFLDRVEQAPGQLAKAYLDLAKKSADIFSYVAFPAQRTLLNLGGATASRVGEAWDRPGLGQLAQLGGRPVLWGGESYGWQSPESFAQAFGPETLKRRTGLNSPEEVYSQAAQKFPKAQKDKPQEKGTVTPTGAGAGEQNETDTSADIDTSTPAKKDPYPGAKIPQDQDPQIGRAFDLIEAALDPERLRQLEDMRLQNLLKSQLLTSELTRQGERARYARDIEKANIDAWKERQIAMYNANAAMAAGLGAATMAAFAPPSASAMSATLSAAMQPFSNISFKRG